MDILLVLYNLRCASYVVLQFIPCKSWKLICSLVHFYILTPHPYPLASFRAPGWGRHRRRRTPHPPTPPPHSPRAERKSTARKSEPAVSIDPRMHRASSPSCKLSQGPEPYRRRKLTTNGEIDRHRRGLRPRRARSTQCARLLLLGFVSVLPPLSIVPTFGRQGKNAAGAGVRGARRRLHQDQNPPLLSY